MTAVCAHLDQIKPDVKPVTPDGCEDCLQLKQPWHELRLCLTCGHVGCCDNSFGKHATAHFKSTGHAVMAGYRSPAPFRWCFIDQLTLD